MNLGSHSIGQRPARSKIRAKFTCAAFHAQTRTQTQAAAATNTHYILQSAPQRRQGHSVWIRLPLSHRLQHLITAIN